MHYTTLVTVEIEPTVEDMDRVTKAGKLIQEMEEKKKENPQHQTVLDICQSEIKMRSTAFSKRIAEEVNAVMAPFYCDADNPDYLEFEDKTEEYRETYENEIVNLVRLPNGMVLTDRQYAWHKYEIIDGRLYERDWGPLHHRKRTKRCKRMQVMENVPYYKVYHTFEEFVEKVHGTTYYEEQKAYGYYYNSGAFYDWYSIGGRWPDMFLVKDDCREYGIADRSWTCADKKNKAPVGYHWTCAARKKDIAWQVMYDWELEQAKGCYARLVDAFENGTLPEGIHGRLIRDDILIFGELVYRKGETEDEYLEQYINLKRKKYPLDIYAFLMEGNWITADWKNELEQFIDNLDNETVLVIVDCHM